MGVKKVELSDKFNNAVYFHTSADIVYFNKWRTTGITGRTAEDAIIQLNDRVNEQIVALEDMQNAIDDMEAKVNRTSNSLGEKVTMFTQTAAIDAGKWEPVIKNSKNPPYIQKVIFRGVRADDTVIISPVQNDDFNQARAQIESYNCISRMIVSDGSVTFMAYEMMPPKSIPVKIIILRKG